MNSISSIRIQESLQKDQITTFFEKHTTTRKILAYGPTFFVGGALTVEQISSYKLLPSPSVPYMLPLFLMFYFSGIAMSCERSLQNRKIEHLNS